MLPADVMPERYEISLAPEAAQLAFSGTVKIAIVVQRPTDSITLNAADLTFRRVALSGVQHRPKSP
jgi:aminopeptidase N